VIHTPEAQLITSISASLVFSTKKNGVQGEVVNHACSGATHCCPVVALVRHVIHLWEHNMASTTPIATYYEANHRRPVTPINITLVLHYIIHLIGLEVCLIEADVSAPSLWAGGSMALLCAQINDTIIYLLGIRQSDAMLRYLHLEDHSVMRNFSAQLRQHVMYDLVQNVQHQNPQED
jgi:hypothetical protein